MNYEQQKHQKKAEQFGTQHLSQCQSTPQRQLISSENNYLKSIISDDNELYSRGWGIQSSQVKEQDHRFDQYIDLLKEMGAVISEKLACGIFQLKNGLTYPGLYAKHHINPGLAKDQGKQQILVAIPVKLLLTSYRAQHESTPQLRAVYKNQQFYHSGPIWQNRILITYILHILSNPDIYQDNLWYKMSYIFSKDIDILSFWDEEQLNKFTDKSISRAAKMQRNNFEQQWKDFISIQHKYQILKDKMFTYQNYRWIYVHCISRCFGSFLNCSYFVPFCQFLNHHCVDVSYACLQAGQFSQKVADIEQQRVQQSMQQKQQVRGEDEDEFEISDISEQSGNSQDYIGENDFAYETVNSYTIKWNSKISYNLKQKQVKQIQALQKKVYNMLEQDVLWKGFGLLYIGEILQKNNVIVNQFMAERKRFTQAKEELQLLAYHIRTFRKHIIQFYKGLGSQYLRDKNAMLLHTQSSQDRHQQSNISKPQPTSSCTPKLPESQPPENPYQTFIMLCHRTQQFKPNSQVYFEYNRLSNRTLLLRYGFCLENNKYEHVWVSKSLAKEIGQYPDLFRKIQEKCISIVFKVKLKPYVLNTQFIVAEKVEKWKMYGNVTQQNAADFQKMFGITDIEQQCQTIQRVIQIYKNQLPKYNQQQTLTSKSLNYHNYFRQVYQNQKIKILKFQIELLKKCKKILLKIKEQKIQIKGNTNILKQIKNICIKQLSHKYLIKCIWGYIKMIAVSVVS